MVPFAVDTWTSSYRFVFFRHGPIKESLQQPILRFECVVDSFGEWAEDFRKQARGTLANELFFHLCLSLLVEVGTGQW